MSSLHDLPQEERPRERLWRHGPETLKTSELLAILLRTGIEGKSALAMGEEILGRYSSLHELSKTSALELSKIKGMGTTKAVQLKAAFEMASRISSSRRKEMKVMLPEHVVELLGDEMRLLAYESLRIIILNSRCNILAIEEVARGTEREAIVEIRDILRAAILHKAASFLIVHNHPSGDPTPSQADCIMTQHVRRAADILNIPFIDHIILGTPSHTNLKAYYSFAEVGAFDEPIIGINA